MGNPRNGFDTSGMVTLYELLRKTGALSLTSEIRTMTGIFRRLPVAELVHDTWVTKVVREIMNELPYVVNSLLGGWRKKCLGDRDPAATSIWVLCPAGQTRSDCWNWLLSDWFHRRARRQQWAALLAECSDSFLFGCFFNTKNKRKENNDNRKIKNKQKRQELINIEL